MHGCCGPDCASQTSDETRRLLHHALDHSIAAMASNRTVLPNRRCRTCVSDSSLKVFCMRALRHSSGCQSCSSFALITESLTAVILRTPNTAPETRSTIQRNGAVFSPAELLPRNPKSNACASSVRLLQCESSLLVMPRKLSTRPETSYGWLNATHSLTHLVLLELSSLRHLGLFAGFKTCCLHGFWPHQRLPEGLSEIQPSPTVPQGSRLTTLRCA